MRVVILVFLLFHNVCNSYGQHKDSLNVCTFVSYKAAVMAYRIPAQKCVLNNKDTNLIKQEIKEKFEIKDSVLSVNVFLAGKYTLAEVTFKNKVCDSATVLFFIDKNKKIICSKSYKVSDNKLDLRYKTFEEGIIVYRKIWTPLEIKTISFAIRIKKGVINDYVDDGVSIWVN